MSNEIIFAILIGSIIFTIFVLIFLYGCLKTSGECSKKEEQELLKKLSDKEYILDDYRLEEDLVYDDEFVRKEDK